VTLGLLAALSASSLLAQAVQAQSDSAALADPPTNIPRTPAMDQACASGSGQQCQDAVVEAIDVARAAEGVGPLELPSYYDSLTLSQQILVLADLERVGRGLPGFGGLSSQLDVLALQGASANTDPNGPSGFSWGSNWAGGEASALLADYDWMYDDGYGSPNMDCTSAPANGCWDHRQNILGDYGSHPSMGAAATRVNGVTSMTQLFSSGPSGHLDYALPKQAPTSSGAVNILAGHGYWEATRDGRVLAYAGAGFRGSASTIHLAQPVVGMAPTPDARGYWEVAADGGVFSFGDAKFFGSGANLGLDGSVVGMAVASAGQGYWLVTKNGSVYSFGDARFYGTPAGRAGEDVVAIDATRDGHGYWEVTADGSVYSFGDARYYGPREPLDPAQPVVGMATTRDGLGYWLVTRAGVVYSFGDAPNYGSLGGDATTRVVGMAVPAHGPGYYMAAINGQVFSFSASSMARAGVARPDGNVVVAMATASS
jgi:hypothetical protein